MQLFLIDRATSTGDIKPITLEKVIELFKEDRSGENFSDDELAVYVREWFSTTTAYVDSEACDRHGMPRFTVVRTA